jgi:predicted GNAT superfamily acetyltransferase
MEIRPLATIEEFRQVFALEMQVWGYKDPQDAVAVPILAITVRNGGILIGAYDGGEMVAFVYSLAGIKHGKSIQWSHMLGVREDHRGTGLGTLLKLEQRKRTIEMGLDTIQWTYDPLQAVNAHLNLHRLGATVGEYEEDAYGESSSPLHRGTPTDRFIADWKIRSAHVERCLGLDDEQPAARSDGRRAAIGEIDRPRPSHVVRDASVGEAPKVNAVVPQGEWLAPGEADLGLTSPRLLVDIPVGFTEMQVGAMELARRWRAATREIFTTCFARGYRAVDFTLDRAGRRGTYLLTNVPNEE